MPDMKKTKEIPDRLAEKRKSLKVAELTFQKARQEARKEELLYELSLIDPQIDAFDVKIDAILHPEKQEEV